MTNNSYRCLEKKSDSEIRLFGDDRNQFVRRKEYFRAEALAACVCERQIKSNTKLRFMFTLVRTRVRVGAQCSRRVHSATVFHIRPTYLLINRREN